MLMGIHDLGANVDDDDDDDDDEREGRES